MLCVEGTNLKSALRVRWGEVIWLMRSIKYAAAVEATAKYNDGVEGISTLINVSVRRLSKQTQAYS